MLKEILRAIISGCTSVKEISEKTGMQEPAAADALMLLAAKGYLCAEYGECPKNAPNCKSCPLLKGQPNLGTNLCITEKGMKYAQEG